MKPIIASPEAPTRQVICLLDILLKPFCPLIPSYIRDDMNFLKHVPTTLSEGNILTSFDVTNVYTNVPHMDRETQKMYK